jgi:hypothetical protein
MSEDLDMSSPRITAEDVMDQCTRWLRAVKSEIVSAHEASTTHQHLSERGEAVRSYTDWDAVIEENLRHRFVEHFTSKDPFSFYFARDSTGAFQGFDVSQHSCS